MRKINKDHEMYYNVLEDIRKSGVCNMWGADVALEYECPELTSVEAREILLEWIENYAELAEKFKWRKGE